MFENLNNKESEKVDDIFSDSDQAEETKPFSAQNAPFSKAMPNVDLPGIKQQVDQISAKEQATINDFDDDFKSHPGGKILKKIFILLIILAVIGLLAYVVYLKILLPKALNVNTDSLNSSVNLDLGTDTKINNKTEEEVVPVIDDTNIVNNEENNTTTEEIIDPLKKMDSDYDLVSDFDELYVYNTDPYNPDSDADGISDFDEVFIFGTNPVKEDSDGDTYSDGMEILSGYNPLGDGKLELKQLIDINLFTEKYPGIYQKLVQ